jgi:chromosome segregation ATPase
MKAKIKDRDKQILMLKQRNADLENEMSTYAMVIENRESEVEKLKLVLQEKDEIIHRRSVQGSFHKHSSQSLTAEESMKKTINELHSVIANLEENIELANEQLDSFESSRQKDYKTIMQLKAELQNREEELEQYRQFYKDNAKSELQPKKKVEKNARAETQLWTKPKHTDPLKDIRRDLKPKGGSIPAVKIGSNLSQPRYSSKGEPRNPADLTKMTRD